MMMSSTGDEVEQATDISQVCCRSIINNLNLFPPHYLALAFAQVSHPPKS